MINIEILIIIQTDDEPVFTVPEQKFNAPRENPFFAGKRTVF
jgi:hypothetical protein